MNVSKTGVARAVLLPSFQDVIYTRYYDISILIHCMRVFNP